MEDFRFYEIKEQGKGFFLIQTLKNRNLMKTGD